MESELWSDICDLTDLERLEYAEKLESIAREVRRHITQHAQVLIVLPALMPVAERVLPLLS